MGEDRLERWRWPDDQWADHHLEKLRALGYEPSWSDDLEVEADDG